jgi:hypothetical protein
VEIRGLVQAEGGPRKFFWISLQPRNEKKNRREAISVGFAERAFVVPGVESQVILEEQVHSTRLDLRDKHTAQALTNPHFTFHAPAWLQLRAKKEEILFQQLACIDLAVPQQRRYPWLRLVSKSVQDLEPYRGTQEGDVEEILLLPDTPSDSLEVRIDFIHEEALAAEQPGRILNRIVKWYEWTLHLAVDVHPTRSTSTFTWFQST